MTGIRRDDGKYATRFGLLSTIDSPLLPAILECTRRQGVADVVVVCDSKLLSEKDHRIFRERVGSDHLRVRGETPSIYQQSSVVTPFFFVDSHNTEFTRQAIQELKIDCLVNAGTPRKLGANILTACRMGVVNVHPGVLPKYRGSSAVEWSIFNDDQVGNTAHFMSEDYDAGAIIRIEEYTFSASATYHDIRRKVYEAGVELAAIVMADIQAGLVTTGNSAKQNEAEAKLWPPIPEPSMQIVLEKLAAGQYKYQRTDVA